jgi:hypothetical protein
MVAVWSLIKQPVLLFAAFIMFVGSLYSCLFALHYYNHIVVVILLITILSLLLTSEIIVCAHLSCG